MCVCTHNSTTKQDRKLQNLEHRILESKSGSRIQIRTQTFSDSEIWIQIQKIRFRNLDSEPEIRFRNPDSDSDSGGRITQLPCGPAESLTSIPVYPFVMIFTRAGIWLRYRKFRAQIPQVKGCATPHRIDVTSDHGSECLWKWVYTPASNNAIRKTAQSSAASQCQNLR